MLVCCGHVHILAGKPWRSSEVGYRGGVEFFTPEEQRTKNREQADKPLTCSFSVLCSLPFVLCLLFFVLGVLYWQ
jgi:hypothetical protein